MSVRRFFFVLMFIMLSIGFSENVQANDKAYILLPDRSGFSFLHERQQKAIEEVKKVLSKFSIDPGFYFTKDFESIYGGTTIRIPFDEKDLSLKNKFKELTENNRNLRYMFYEKQEDGKEEVEGEEEEKEVVKKGKKEFIIDKIDPYKKKEEDRSKEIKKLTIFAAGSRSMESFIKKIKDALLKRDIKSIVSFNKDVCPPKGECGQNYYKVKDNSFDVVLFFHSFSDTRLIDEFGRKDGLMDSLMKKSKTNSVIFIHFVSDHAMRENASPYLKKIHKLEDRVGQSFNSGIFLGRSGKTKDDFVFPSSFEEEGLDSVKRKYEIGGIYSGFSEYKGKSFKDYTNMEIKKLVDLLVKVVE